MNYMPPAGAVNWVRRWIVSGIILAVIAAATFASGWKLHWWMAGQGADNQAHIIRDGYSNQQTLREQVTQQIANVATEGVQITQAAADTAEVSALESQRIATVNIACQDASEITGDPLPPQQRQWVASNCLAGSIRPGSAYDSTKG